MTSRSQNYFSFLKFNELRPKLQRDFYKPYFTFAKESVPPPPAWQDIVRKREAQVSVLALQPNQESVSVSAPVVVEKEESVTKNVPPVEDLVNDYVFDFENLDSLYKESVYMDEEFEQILKDITLYPE